MGAVESTSGAKDFDKTNIPAGTIKRGFNVYEHGNWTGLMAPDRVIARNNSSCAGDGHNCDGGNFNVKTIFRADGNPNRGKHRDVCCETYKAFRGDVRDCGNCELAKNDSDARRGFISGYKVPVGMYLTSQSGNASGNTGDPTGWYCAGGGGQTNVGWGYGGGGGSSHVPDDVAVGCSGGWDMGQKEWPKTLNGYQFRNSNQSTHTGKSDECWVGVAPPNAQDDVVCTTAGRYNKTFCQLGDYVYSDKDCKALCEDTRYGGAGHDYCKHALDRVCAAVPGEPIKRLSDGKTLVKISDTNQPMFHQQICQDYCDTAESNKCKDIKTKACSQNGINAWKNDPKVGEYCKAFWRNNMDTTSMNKVCKDPMTKHESGQSAFSGKGCGFLCKKGLSNVSDAWCEDRKADYCTRNDAQMLTKDCGEFCEKYPERCEKYLHGMCQKLDLKTEEQLNAKVGTTGYNWAHWCGCMQPTSFYQDRTDERLAKFDELGYNVRGTTDISPECSYPLCIEGSIMTESQKKNKESGHCKQCVQLMLQTFENATFINSEIANQQAAECSNIERREDLTSEPLSAGVYKSTDDGNHYEVFPDNSYCKYKNISDFNLDAYRRGFAVNEVDRISKLNTPRTGEDYTCYVAPKEDTTTEEPVISNEISKQDNAEEVSEDIIIAIVVIVGSLFVAGFIIFLAWYFRWGPLFPPISTSSYGRRKRRY